MQTQSNDIKLQFRTREGYYRLMNSPDYSQKATGGFNTGTASNEKTCIKVSLVTLNEDQEDSPSQGKKATKKICFNVGRELFVYNYDGVRAGPDASNPIYKHSYKGSAPTCHDFNQTTASSSSLSLLVGFSHGQCQLIEMNSRGDKEVCREFNFDRQIDKTRATCIKWLPNSPSLFLVAHASGNLYLYKDDLPCGPSAPVYQLYKQSDGVLIYTCKSKTTRNPIYMWVIGSNSTQSANNPETPNFRENDYCSLNEFAFSYCAKYFACVSQDGFLRVYCYDTMELIGRARSYYGGLTCICWSPDGKYIVTGGEDDLVTVWSFVERRVVARGVGHKSWVTVVSFDPFCSSFPLKKNDDEEDDEKLDLDELSLETIANRSDKKFNETNDSKCCDSSPRSTNSSVIKSYRFGSVGQDTQLCLWDLNDDMLRQPIGCRNISKSKPITGVANNQSLLSQNNSKDVQVGTDLPSTDSFSKTKGLINRRDKFGSKRKSDKNLQSITTAIKPDDDPVHLLGTPICPRMNEVPLLEPIVCKRISLETLTSLLFCKGGFITSCQEGYVISWARPSKVSLCPCRSNEDLRVIDVVTSSVHSPAFELRNYYGEKSNLSGPYHDSRML